MCFKVNRFLSLSTGLRHTPDPVSSSMTQALHRAGPLSAKTDCTFVLADPHPCTIDAVRSIVQNCESRFFENIPGPQFS